MLSMGAAPAEVATELARSAEPGDREAIDALREAAQSVGGPWGHFELTSRFFHDPNLAYITA